MLEYSQKNRHFATIFINYLPQCVTDLRVVFHFSSHRKLANGSWEMQCYLALLIKKFDTFWSNEEFDVRSAPSGNLSDAFWSFSKHLSLYCTAPQCLCLSKRVAAHYFEETAVPFLKFLCAQEVDAFWTGCITLRLLRYRYRYIYMFILEVVQDIGANKSKNLCHLNKNSEIQT